MPFPKPVTVPGGWGGKDKTSSPTVEEKNPADSRNIPRTAAGVVGDSGEILDDSGKAIGRISDSKDLGQLVGSTVTGAGDVVDSSGNVLGRALLTQGEDTEYTTHSGNNDDKNGGGWNLIGKGKSAYQTANTLQQPISQAGNLITRLRKPSEDAMSSSNQQDVESEHVLDESQETIPKDETKAIEQGKLPGKDVDEGEERPIDLENRDEENPAELEKTQEPAVDLEKKAKESPIDSEKKDEETPVDLEKKDEEKPLDDEGKPLDEQQDDLQQVPPEPTDDKAIEEAGTDEAKDLSKDEAGDLTTTAGEGKGEVDEKDLEKVPGEDDQEKQPGEEDQEKPLDYAALKGTKVNKAGNLVNSNGDVIGHLVEGEVKKLIGKRSDEEGNIWNDAGKVIGKAEPLPDTEREDLKDFAPFENFPDAVVESDGRVMSEGKQVGVVVEGDFKRLKGSKVDEDGDILDRRGNVIGKAEAWDEPEAEPEPEKDRSILAGKRVNKASNLVDSSGTIFGKVVEGNVSSLVGRMSDKEGNIRSESGDVIGKAEVVSEGEREGLKEGPFAELSGCTVAKDGKIVTPSGDVVGRLVTGDPKTLFGRAVDEDGDVVDRNGNVLAKAERWEEPEVEKKKNPLAGRRVNREGNVLDEDGNIIGKLVSGDITICSGKEVDEDGDVLNSKGNTIGNVALLEDIPPEVGESPEDKEKREQLAKDKKLAEQLAGCIEQTLDKIRPICKLISDKIDTAERTPKEELDEEQLVREVKPLIEEGGKILTETNGTIRGLDPDGRIQRNAKHKSGTKEATPEEYHLADVLKELTGTVTETIDNAKRKIENMPHAKKELNPLWGLLAEPLFQIIAAVGLLLTGVLGLVGKLLSGLGLGGLVDGLLGGLGITKLLDGLGLGSAVSALTGKKDKKK